MLFSTNPYVSGNPVGDSSAFVGRDDILRAVLRVLRHPQENAIVLYGQRRIGKTSILQTLETKLSTEGAYHPIFFDLQDKAQWPLERVLQALAQKISDKLELPSPNLGDDPKTTFCQVWLPKLLSNLSQDSSLVLLFDEFDVLADPESEKAEAAFFLYLRDLLTTYTKHLNLVFFIGRKVDDLSNIALSLFKGTHTERVSLLSHEDSVKLIRLSEANKSLNWSDDAIEKVWKLTCGHPFLTQRLCSHVWERLYEDDPDESPTVTPKNIEAAIPDTLSASGNFLEWLWDGLPPAEQVVISALAGAGAKPMTENELEQVLRESGVQIVIRELQNAPRLLQDWDFIEPANGGYRFRVELQRRWIADYKPLSRVLEVLNRIERLYQTGLDYYRRGQSEVALTFLRQVIASNPKHVGASQQLAEILLAQDQVSEAYELLEKLYQYQPTVARSNKLIRALLALAQSSDNKNEQLKYYERILKLDSEHQDAKSRLQQILQQQQKKLFLTAIGKILTWFIYTLLFGLLPLWLVLLDYSFQNKSQIFLFEQFIISGALLFFVTAIVVSITIDYHFLSNNILTPLNLTISVIFPLILLLSCVALFYIPYGKPIQNIELDLLYTTELGILWATFIYAIFIKFHTFKINKEFSTMSKTLWKTSGKSILWAIGTLVFGLLQVWLVFGHNSIVKDNHFQFDQFVADGSLLFFATAIVSSITIDYLLSMKTACCNPYEILLFIVFPLLILLCCVALFYIPYGKETIDIEIDLLYSMQKGILIATFIYGIVVKYHAFKPFKEF
jgi:tetratricopeptide (TPR) repeat protein